MRTIVLAAALITGVGCGGAGRGVGEATGPGGTTASAPEPVAVAAARYAAWATPAALPEDAPAWLAGRWRTTDGRTVEHWVGARGRLWGVALNLARPGDAAFEVMYAERLGPTWTFFAMPGGADPTPFPEGKRNAEQIAFSRGGQDFPGMILYGRKGDAGLTATLTGGGPKLELIYAVDDAPVPGELATADAALGAAFEDGPEATFALLHDDVALTGGARSVRVREGVEAALAPLVAPPELLRLDAVTGGLGPDGQTGYTLGDYARQGGAEHGVYVAIWVKDGPAGAWRLRHLHLGPPTPGS